jgi:hypothetical protein
MSAEEVARPSAGVVLLASALGLGVLADALLRGPLGLGAALVLLGLLAAVLTLQRGFRTAVGTGRAPYVAAAVLPCLGLVWRDAGVLKALDVLTFLVAFALLASRRAGQRENPSLVGHAIRVLDTGVHVPLSPMQLLVADIEWSDFSLRPAMMATARVVRGFGLAAPIVIVFATLLISADPVFAARVGDVFEVDLAMAIQRLFEIAVCSWIAAGLLRVAVLRPNPIHEPPARPGWLGLDPIEVGTVLALIDVLFAAFVWIQVRYLFGGAAWVRTVAGLSYSDYARRGFFELVWVVALVLPLLLLAHWLLGPSARGARMFAFLGGLQVALVLVILASALVRMGIYQAEYGQTELRFYSTAFMLWLGVLLAGFAATVLRGRRADFVHVVAASAVVALVALHLVDPERRIVTANDQAPRRFDAEYTACLSADAVPALLEAVHHQDPYVGRKIAAGLLATWGAPEDVGFREWSVSRARARVLVRSAAPELSALIAPKAGQ